MFKANYSFITKWGLSPYGWLHWNCKSALKKGMTASACFKKQSKLDHCKWHAETMTVPFKCMTAAPLK